MRPEQFHASPALTISGGPAQSPAAKVGEDLARRVVARRPGDTAARMRARTTHVKTRKRAAIVPIPEHRPRREHLIELQPGMEDVAHDEAKDPLEVERAHDLPPQ